jgi:hypothetical protein
MVASTQQYADGFANASYFMPQKDLINNSNKRKPERERACSKAITPSEIVEVYMDNFYKELERIEALVQDYNFIAMVSILSVFTNLSLIGYGVSRRCVQWQHLGKISVINML